MTTEVANDDGQADLSSHDSFVDGAPHRTFRRMRDEDPVAWCEYPAGRGFWSITRYQDIIALNSDPALMSSAQGIRMEDQTHEEYLARRTFQETDPPEHTRVRRLVAKAFSKPVLAGFEEQIRAICTDILDQAMAQRELDAVEGIARQLPMRILGRILGTPNEDLEWLVEKGDALIANTDPDFTAHVLDQADTDAYRFMPFRSPAGAELYDYARRMMARKQTSGDTSGVLHLVLAPDEHGNRIGETEFLNFFCLLVAAGNDTTRYSLAAAIRSFAHSPAVLDQLGQSDAGVWETAPDEFIRRASPAMYFRRTATRDLQLHGKTILAGDKVLLWFVSGNHDERQFTSPFEVDVRRTPNKHLAFGRGGPHVCLGMWLARLEVRVMLQEFARRIAAVEQTGAHAFLRSNFVGGIKRLPVRLRPR